MRLKNCMKLRLYRALYRYWCRKLTSREIQQVGDKVGRYECFLGMMSTYTRFDYDRYVAYYAYTEAKKIYKQRGRIKT